MSRVSVLGPDGQPMRDENGNLITVDMEQMAEDGPPLIPTPTDGVAPPRGGDTPIVETYEAHPVPFYETDDFVKYRNS